MTSGVHAAKYLKTMLILKNKSKTYKYVKTMKDNKSYVITK